MQKTIQLIQDRPRREEARKEEAGYIRRTLRRITDSAFSVAITASIMLGSTKSEAYCSQSNESIEDAVNTKDQNLASMRMKSARGVETLAINKKCVSSSFVRTSSGESLTIRFEDGSSLKIELEKGAIQRVLIRNPGSNCPVETPESGLEGILNGTQIVDVSSSPGPNAKHFSTFDRLPTTEEVVFKRGDGVEVVLELRPGAIKSIEYLKG